MKNSLIKILFLLLMVFGSISAQADEIIKDFEDESVGVLNEELRRLRETDLWEHDGTNIELKTAKPLDMQTQKINNVTDPTSNQDAATKKYADDMGQSAGGDLTGTYPNPTLVTTPVQVKTGTYTGNGTAGTAVAHGLGVTPAFVAISSIVSQTDCAIWIAGMGSVYRKLDAHTTVSIVSTPNTTNFYLGDNAPGNRSGVTYYWVAIAPN